MISIDDAKRLAEESGLRQVIVFGWDGARTHVATYGESTLDSAQAAEGANQIKKEWGWPENTIAASAKVKALQDRNTELEDRVVELEYLLNRLDIEE